MQRFTLKGNRVGKSDRQPDSRPKQPPFTCVNPAASMAA